MAEQNVVNTPEQFDGGFEGGFDEDFGGEGGSGDSVAHGQGQSKSSRRRRRKRKTKVAGEPSTGAAEAGSGAQQQTFIMEGESLALAASAAPATAPAPVAAPAAPASGGGQQRRQNQGSGAPQPQQGQAGQAAGGKRWKKKFRDRERRPRNENPGNDFRAEAPPANQGGSGFGGGANFSNGGGNFGGGGFARKGKQNQGRRERPGFVGPMDHSYREVNGNFADSPPSTIQVHGAGYGRKGGHRHHGDNQPIDHNMPRPVPIPENAQTHIYFFIEDLFFTAKIQEAAKKQGVKVAFIKNEKEALAELTSGEERDRPALIVFDLNNANAKPLTLIPKLKTKLKKSASIIGFLSHLQGDLKAKAVEAGCDTVMPRAAFSQNLPNLLRRYGVHEEEETNFNM